MDKAKARLPLRELVLFALLGSMTFGAKLAMMGLPNIEPVSLFVMLFAVAFGRRAIYPIYVYVFLELTVYGFRMWSVSYLYVWALLAFAAWCLRGMTSPWGWAVLSGGFGLLFGALCAPVYLVTGGVHAAVSWWLSGIPYDLLHCAGNFVMALVLFVPLRRALERLYEKLKKDLP